MPDQLLNRVRSVPLEASQMIKRLRFADWPVDIHPLDAYDDCLAVLPEVNVLSSRASSMSCPLTQIIYVCWQKQAEGNP